MYYNNNNNNSNMELSKQFGEVQAICCGENKERGSCPISWIRLYVKVMVTFRMRTKGCIGF